MNPEETSRLEAIESALGGAGSISKWNADGNDLLLGFSREQEKRQKFVEAFTAALDSAASRVRASGAASPEDVANALEQGASSIRTALQVTN